MKPHTSTGWGRLSPQNVAGFHGRQRTAADTVTIGKQASCP